MDDSLRLEGLAAPEGADSPAIPKPESVTEQDLREALEICLRQTAIANQWIERAEAIKQAGKELVSRERSLEERAAAIGEREADAEAGFTSLLEAEKETVRQEIELQVRSQLEAEYQERFDARDAELEVALAAAIDAKERIKSEREKTQSERNDLLDRQLAFAAEVGAFERQEGDAAVRHAYLERRVRELEGLVETQNEEIQELRGYRSKVHRMEALLAGDDLSDVLARLRELELQHDIASSENGHSTARDLSALRRRLSDQEQVIEDQSAQLSQAIDERDELRRSLALNALSTVNVESWQELVEVSRQESERLAHEIGALREASAAEPFPRLSRLDASTQLAPPESRKRSLDLASLCRALKNQLVNPIGEPLHYDIDDIRTFIAGLATSRLLLLQGASGTGKTSLPRAVATALGWGEGTVAVQAGWRDQQDLIGYYNAFERRFQESDFLEYLYKAATDAFKTRPFLLVLDEANLSSMEYYFASFLSALEMRDQQSIHLAPSPLPNAPRLTDAGRTLDIPDNVWFVATANKDETTRRFAPKTIDRSTIVELVRENSSEGRSSRQPRDLEGASMKLLRDAFRSAKLEHQDAVANLSDIPMYVLEAVDEVELAVGERFKTHLTDFSTAFLSCGGTAERAVELMWLRKVLYRLPRRGEGESAAIDMLTQALKQMWRDQGLEGDLPTSWAKRLDKATR